MTAFQPINSKAYYDFLPTSESACGDIWIGLPSMGLFDGPVSGVVISPACDLSNFKTETITFLPIIPIRAYFSNLAFLPTLRREISERFRSAGFLSRIAWPEPGYILPRRELINDDLTEIELRLANSKATKAEKEHLTRAAAGLRVIKSTSSPSLASLEDVALLLGTKWSSVKTELVRNSHRPDLHFLPKDFRDGSTPSHLEAHSLVLLRYPITLPAEFLHAAQHCLPGQWDAFLKSSDGSSWAHLQGKSDIPPLKCLSVKQAFLADMLSRFTALFSRVGSPDFSRSTIEKYMLEMEHD
ncbi:hypothetical protein [Rhizobium leguminosarum]|uniref:hypothetical protein n=1 Tax=Rhizobium leguminosarum TaxID=384 RepID=UPI001C922BEF|nr:hypothetical protein [Rhizobium leguminosarum]MBY3044179.1 hypothetical protein [Rhizobium leguminosarum]